MGGSRGAHTHTGAEQPELGIILATSLNKMVIESNPSNLPVQFSINDINCGIKQC